MEHSEPVAGGPIDWDNTQLPDQRVLLGYTPPFLVYLVERTDQTGDLGEEQAGGCTTEAEAERLQALLEAEGRGPFRINTVPIHVNTTDWEYDR
jgi:hypothetical protein